MNDQLSSKNSHFNPLHLDAPRLGGLVQRQLHAARDGHPLTEDFVQVARSHRVPERGLGQQPGRVVGIFDVRNRHGRVRNPVVHDGVHRHRHAVLGENLFRGGGLRGDGDKGGGEGSKEI